MTSDQNTPQLLNPHQAAKLLGVNASTLAVWRCRKRYALRYIKVGSKIRYRLTDIHNFLESRTVEPTVVAKRR